MLWPVENPSNRQSPDNQYRGFASGYQPLLKCVGVNTKCSSNRPAFSYHLKREADAGAEPSTAQRCFILPGVAKLCYLPTERKAMPFPDSPRVTYRRHVLESVICQLRYPPVLRIETELPARFQEAVRNQYPVLAQLAPIDSMMGMPPDMLTLVKSMLPVSVSTTYAFSSEDECWKVTLSKESIALECKGSYTTWEDFMRRFIPAIDALRREYAPPFFNRLGLRYVDIVRRSKLNLENVPWRDLLNPNIAGELASSISEDVQEATHTLIVKLNERGDRVRMNHGLMRTHNPEEISYLIDNDFFSEQRTESGNVTTKLDELHRESGNCFRWCVSGTLHDAMEPEPVAVDRPA